MAAIAEAGRGVVVVLRESIAASLSSMVSQKLNLSNEASNNRELRDYGVGAQILTDLGIRKMILLSDTRPNVVSLEGYDLEITDWQRIHQEQA
jgi:3,4-dihydroxy 2-butanone 4-phosphate synthase/GTP cyclohydrolase II